MIYAYTLFRTPPVEHTTRGLLVGSPLSFTGYARLLGDFLFLVKPHLERMQKSLSRDSPEITFFQEEEGETERGAISIAAESVLLFP